MTSDALLLADLGNSRLKLVLAAREPSAATAMASGAAGAFAIGAPSLRVHAAVVLDADAELGTRLQRLDGSWRAPLGALSSVARPEVELGVAAWMRARCSRRFESNPPPTLRIATREPELTGRDRVYGAAGAWERCRRACLSVDCGTALTVNLVRVSAGAPEFAGGAIAPGAALLARALARGGARLFDVEPRRGVAALGSDTRSALEAGVLHGLRGAARELCARIEHEHGGAELPIVCTGGARSLLLDPPCVLGRTIVDSEFLVLEGLAAALCACNA